ncbi:hypothetical protein ABL840_26820 [Variovorax sp. NFACC27]|uniref:hypothetical protein n=1 Tax=unclassified Variovorax TaxID=663243 RepID=UPI000896A181|nr:hypothetical protein SAMN03159371_03686 [Variovorax sp. NFACC28]SEG78044.1 hypothetical protein SAMN03159365_03765 [Variovorax sp. NFACC29]SFC96135.1 hypothetical protein SAMN03159379_03658 [Variovorax sp. NFACC26]SFG09211.1 hypothetical protein SAMN03159447_01766 [Variovorax sp. NFACC27]
MTVHILGIDPGASTGLAAFDGGVITFLKTIEPHSIEHNLRHYMPARVVFEDSRLERRVWNARSKKDYGAALATARSLGQVDAWCSLITAVCADLGIPAHGISPTAKGAKLDAAAFELVTRWATRSNQHERDAAMVAWPYRRTAR